MTARSPAAAKRRAAAKPIPAGLVSPRAALAVAVAGLVVGVVLSAPSGAATVAVAVGGVGLGYVYDLRLSRTPWSWLPLALALPLLPLHAWLGASGSVPPGLVTLIPTAVLAGAALAIANGLVDIERDGRAGRRTIAVRLGQRRAWVVQTALVAIVGGLAIAVAPAVPPDAVGIDRGILRALRLAGVVIGIVALGVGPAGGERQNRQPERAALRRESHMPRLREQRRERGVQTQPGIRVEQSHAVGADHPHPVSAHLIDQRLLCGPAVVASFGVAGRDHHQ